MKCRFVEFLFFAKFGELHSFMHVVTAAAVVVVVVVIKAYFETCWLRFLVEYFICSNKKVYFLFLPKFKHSKIANFQQY